ncbi:MAG: hypothetical protein ACMUJM_05275 [bacterium]
MRKKFLLLILTLMVAWALILSSSVQAQDWVAMPPYNLLWPLWSEVYSPISPTTGLPTPLLSEVTSSTILPVQPTYLYNPNGFELPMGYVNPWLLYNSPTGVIYYDVFFGLNPFPPPELLDPTTGAPVPIALPLGWSILKPPPLSLALYLFELSNLYYMIGYGNALGTDPASLLTYYDVYGTPGVLTSTSW